MNGHLLSGVKPRHVDCCNYYGKRRYYPGIEASCCADDQSQTVGKVQGLIDHSDGKSCQAKRVRAMVSAIGSTRGAIIISL